MKSRSNLMVVAVSLLLYAVQVAASGHSVRAKNHTYVYVSLDSSRCILIYRANGENGELSLAGKVDLGGVGGSLAVDPAKTHLYAAVRSTNNIACFRIDPANGALSPAGVVRAAGNPVYLKTDKTGKFLFSAYFADSKAAIYRIRSEGTLHDSAAWIFDTEKNAHAIQTDPSNRFLYIPCRTGETIHQFKFDQSSGIPSPNTPDRLSTPTSTGPRHLTFHPTLNLIYVVNEFGNSVTTYRMISSDGALTPLQSYSILPSDFAGKNTAADIHLTPDNRFLYASNRGHESIAGFAVDPATGQLSPIGNFPTEKTPRSFALDPSGKFLYAGGQGSGKIAAYRIDQNSGALVRFATYDAGQNPAWVLVVNMQSSE